MSAFLLIAVALQGGAPPQQLPPSPVARIVITPATREVRQGDTLRFSARALDANGQSVPGARIVFRKAGGEGGDIDSTGRLVAGTTGIVTAAVIALVDGRAPKAETFSVRLTPGPAARIVVTPNVKTMAAGQTVPLEAKAYSAAGDLRRGDVFAYSSSAPRIAMVTADGVISARAAGTAVIGISDGRASTELSITVVAARIASAEIQPAKVSVKQGDVVHFKVIPRDATSNEIPGLNAEWTVSGGQGMIEQDGTFVAYDAPAKYTVMASIGGRSVRAIVEVGYRDVRRPVNVVARVPRTQFATSEVWLHPNGTTAYLGSGGGGDRFWSIDISNPAKPVVVDSVVMNARLVNDIMTSADGKVLVATREGAPDHKNGIVICSTEDPLHPKVIGEFTDGVTAGVHSAFVNTQAKYGTHVYLTNDGTGALNIVDINDPAHPKLVATYKPPRNDAGRYLSDVGVQDGMLYASWWNDGLVILDVGNGIKGGSPSSPQFVAQYKYDLTDMYRDAAIESGIGLARGTHTALRFKNYVFVADEVHRGEPMSGAKDASANRMYGNLQVIDVSDVLHPHPVAFYKPEVGGVHNVWVAGDTLYMGVSDGGFRAFDVSGELRGDLRAQGREIASFNTADMDGVVKNAAQTRSVVVNAKDGLAYVSDANNVLWVIRIELRPATILP